MTAHQTGSRWRPATATRFALCLIVVCLIGAWLPVAMEAGETASQTAAGSDQGEPETYTNTVRWATASESDNFGYHVYRGDNEDGPFEQLTDDPIAGAGNTDETHRYEFVDDTIDPYRAYFYYVEAVSMAGVQTRFTPIIQAAPKLPADKAEPDTDSEEDADRR